MHPFRVFIRLYTPIGEADWERGAACLAVRTVPAGTCLVEAGHVCGHR